MAFLFWKLFDSLLLYDKFYTFILEIYYSFITSCLVNYSPETMLDSGY